MAKTGEKYVAARRQLIESSAESDEWVSYPEASEEAVQEATGKSWDEWRAIIDAGPGRDAAHGHIVDYVVAQGVDGWWAQSVAVGYERISGIRLPHQMADGTFTAGKTKTVTIDTAELRAMIFDDEARDDLFPGLGTALRSKPEAKVPRIRIGPGVAQVAIEEKPEGRATVTIAHEKLPSPEEVESWKAYWSGWLDTIDEA
jgi:hypothetical protein